MTLLHRVRTNKPGAGERSLFLVSDRCLPQTIDVLRSRAEPLDIDLHVGPMETMTFDARVFGVLLQYPDESGLVQDLAPFIRTAHDAGALVAVGTDLLALALLTPPGEMGADVVFGNSQRFGVPLGYGGPHAAFFATRNAFVRQTPGRIIGVSVDAHGRRAYRMALATREQHIRREKATSNICTAQALLANMAAMYAVYHGPEGLKAIAGRVHALTRAARRGAAGARAASRPTRTTSTRCASMLPDGVEELRRQAARGRHQLPLHRRHDGRHRAQRDRGHRRRPRHRQRVCAGGGEAGAAHRLRRRGPRTRRPPMAIRRRCAGRARS